MRIRRFNEKREEEEEPWTPPIKGPDKQDVAHWEIVIEHGQPFLKISTDDDTYYVSVKNLAAHKGGYQDDYDDDEY